MDIEKTVAEATYHSPIRVSAGLEGQEERTFLYSTLELAVPVPGGHKQVLLRRKVECPLGNDMRNEEAGAIRYFANAVGAILKFADKFEEDVYADDDEEFDRPIGKSSFQIDRGNLADEPQPLYRFESTFLDLRRYL